MNTRWLFTKIAVMIVIAIRIITWNDVPLYQYRIVPITNSFTLLSDDVGDFQ